MPEDVSVSELRTYPEAVPIKADEDDRRLSGYCWAVCLLFGFLLAALLITGGALVISLFPKP